MKKKTRTGIVLWSIFGLFLLFTGLFFWGGYRMFGEEMKAIRSLREIRPGVYTFTFEGDYGFDAFLSQGGAKTDAQMALYIASFLSHGYIKAPAPDITVEGCSSLGTGDLFLRNFDFSYPGNYVIIKAIPQNGYKSISTGNFAFMGGGRDWHPVSGMKDTFMALATLYVPLDGMNEKGLCVADLISIDGQTSVPDTPKGDLTIVAAIRLLLDKAADVDEAEELLGKYDVFPSIGSAHHLALSDAKGKSAVFEWKDGILIRTDTPALTNHEISGEGGDDPRIAESISRLGKLLCAGSATTAGEGFKILEQVHYDPDTRWSIVYDKKNLTGTWCFPPDWENKVEVTLP